MTIQHSSTERWKPVRITGFMEKIGPLLRSTSVEDKHIYGLQTSDDHQNHIGLIHGGVVASLLDQVIALVAWNAADRQPIVTLQMDTRFLGSARSGDFLETRATIQHATRSLMFVDAEVSCSNRQVASATAIMKISRQSGKNS